MKLIKTTPEKIIFSIISLCCLTVAGIMLRRNVSQILSVQAYVNGEIIAVRAPIPGKLELKNEKVKLSKQLKKGAQIGIIKSTTENPRVSVLIVEKRQLETHRQDIQQQLSGIRQQIKNRADLMSWFKQQSDSQKNLQRSYASQQIKQYEGQHIQSKASEKLAFDNAQRYKFLSKKGAVSRSVAEGEITKAQQAFGKLKETQSQIKQAKLNFEATKVGLQLDGTRTLSYPETRVYTLEVELTDLKQQERNLEKQIQSTQFQLSTTSKELQVQQNVLVLSPATGVIWSIDSQPQEIVEANQSIIKLLNCHNLWIEAFINENDSNKLVVGQAAEITLNNSNNTQWKGRIETIRSGTGRVEVGQYVVEPPPEISRRQIPVRIATVRIKVDWHNSPINGNFCLVGRSVNVRFPE
jgi:multidrug resistance efflux pump